MVARPFCLSTPNAKSTFCSQHTRVSRFHCSPECIRDPLDLHIALNTPGCPVIIGAPIVVRRALGTPLMYTSLSTRPGVPISSGAVLLSTRPRRNLHIVFNTPGLPGVLSQNGNVTILTRHARGEIYTLLSTRPGGPISLLPEVHSGPVN